MFCHKKDSNENFIMNFFIKVFLKKIGLFNYSFSYQKGSCFWWVLVLIYFYFNSTN